MAPLSRFDRLDADRQGGLLAAAAAEFAALGFDGASLSRIAAEAGISKAAIYYYFEDKLDLLVTAFRHYEREIQADFAALFTTTDAPGFWAAIETVVADALTAAQENPAWIGMGRVFYQLPRGLWASTRLGAWIEEKVAETMRLVEHGQRVGAVRTDLPATLLSTLMMAINEPLERWFLEAWDAAPDPDRRWMFAVSVDMFRRLLRPPEEA
ncbi:MAG: TetR/AcrR family transcriptional regulator [Myxococcales bacterium]|nr:TetR/AcrR family transcriptional regulator [Myxococcales bacterium]